MSGAVSRIAHWGSPTGGWNNRDNIVGMPLTDAVRLDNIFPDTTQCRLRGGSQQFAQLPDATTPVRSLMTYSSASGDQLLAAQGDSIYSVLGGSTNPEWDHFNWDEGDWATLFPVASGFGGSDIWQYENFSTPGGQFLVAVNGTNQQWIYDGTSYGAGVNTYPDPEGPIPAPPPSNTFCCIAAFEQRLFFTGTDNLYLYYLPVNVFQGELHGIDLGGFLPAGGAIACLGTWTRDDGFGGMDDILVIISTNGEVLSFTGTDPDDASTWGYIGRFVIGRPVSGHRQMTRLGPDLLVICDDGFQPMAKYLAMGQSEATGTALSYKIGNAVTMAVRLGKELFGWEGILWPNRNALLVNVPQPDGSFQQYVTNTISGAWCRFLGLNAYCWARIGNELYFGAANGAIIQADYGADDQGQPINYDLVTSFQLPGSSPMMLMPGAQQKRATMCRAYLMTDGQINAYLDVNTDYNIATVGAAVQTGSADTEWDTPPFLWDQAPWAGTLQLQSQWYSVQGVGNAFSIHMQGLAKAAQMQILAFDLSYESGTGFI